ncbi:MAG: LLM class F420-dependent oxidoreductase [Candidatus Dadabacteria bacterium]|nr:LLM class F420-dependent oxidoreductase [Candidatus Dadabacteria bacterium]NIS08951.1 LLM class F420-dependent oxidoreductase [Candidatus Dadabacteria bacterium]NIV41666.1 TIGR03619 family F420-dependent LLM class oxidoreductase [Candidatus Dadabacteria bacterium]NIY21390.1 TIGR03619 family F420-dependent LLM class oxidoreductase [Candidatus Dadabacteria bacterium]
MNYGIMMFATDYAMHPAELAEEVEDRGFESLWFPEHTHIPASRESAPPGGGELPEHYWHTYDLFIALTAAATATTTLKIATGICLIIERDPITTAKEVATLDVLSGGRLIFGIGGGWNAEEMANHGTDYKKRWRIMRERILAMKEIWTADEPEYHGKFVDFDKIWSYPKPSQKPYPPIILGGDGPRTFDRIIEYCDGWLPIVLPSLDLDAKIKQLKDKAQDSGRDPAEISVSCIIPAPLVNDEMIDKVQGSDVERVVLGVPPGEEDTVIAILDKLAESVL